MTNLPEVEEITKVVFRIYPNGDVIALFPEDPCDVSKWWLCASYMHIGQHGAANYDIVICQTKPATPEQYAALKKELESAPYEYKFEVRQRCSAAMCETRRKNHERMMQ